MVTYFCRKLQANSNAHQLDDAIPDCGSWFVISSLLLSFHVSKLVRSHIGAVGSQVVLTIAPQSVRVEQRHGLLPMIETFKSHRLDQPHHPPLRK